MNNLYLVPNISIHNVHFNGFSTVLQGLLLFFKWSDFKKLLSHFEHLKGFSPVWVLSSFFKLPACENAFIHLEDLNGFSPVWVLSSTFKEVDLEKTLVTLCT